MKRLTEKGRKLYSRINWKCLFSQKSIVAIVLSAVAVISFSCKNDEPGVPLASITLNKQNTEIYMEETEALTAIITPSDAANKAVTWSTDNKYVATVNNKGEVTGKYVGTAIITATSADGSRTASCFVKVKPKEGITAENFSWRFNIQEITLKGLKAFVTVGYYGTDGESVKYDSYEYKDNPQWLIWALIVPPYTPAITVQIEKDKAVFTEADFPSALQFDLHLSYKKPYALNYYLEFNTLNDFNAFFEDGNNIFTLTTKAAE